MLRRDAILGSLYGGAIGDGLGCAFERGQPHADPLEPVSVSDDTQLTLATCEAIAEAGGVDPAGIAASFLNWFRQGRLSGLGSSTLKALRDLDAGAHWALAGAAGEYSAGNGAAMRAAPLAFLLDPGKPADRARIRDVARITHRNEEAYVGALAIVCAVRLAALGGWDPADSLPLVVSGQLPDSRVRDALRQTAKLGPLEHPRTVAETVGNSGFVAESVPLAIHAAQAVVECEVVGAIRRVVDAGGDADTIGSMTGQIAGAWAGARGHVPRFRASDACADLATRISDYSHAVLRIWDRRRSVPGGGEGT